MVPVPVVLRDFVALSAKHGYDLATVEEFWSFLELTLLRRAALPQFRQTLEAYLRARGGLFLLDGFDKVPEANRHRERLKQCVQALVATYPKCRVLLNSRPYAYQRSNWQQPKFVVSTLLPLTAPQIGFFVDAWYEHAAARGKFAPGSARAGAKDLKRVIAGSKPLADLARRPILLALMASLHAYHGGQLPEDRAALYEQAVQQLLERWDRRRFARPADEDDHGRNASEVMESSVAEWLGLRDKAVVRRALEELAFKGRGCQPEEAETADLTVDEVAGRLLEICNKQGADSTQVHRYLTWRTGLLVSHGEEVLRFPHASIQDYLAACHLAEKMDPLEAVRLARTDSNLPHCPGSSVCRVACLRCFKASTLPATSEPSPGAISSCWATLAPKFSTSMPCSSAPSPPDLFSWAARKVSRTPTQTSGSSTRWTSVMTTGWRGSRSPWRSGRSIAS